MRPSRLLVLLLAAALAGPPVGEVALRTSISDTGGPDVPPPAVRPPAIAGGYTPRAFRGPVEIRRNVNGDVVRFIASIAEFVRPGDTIVVNERWF